MKKTCHNFLKKQLPFGKIIFLWLFAGTALFGQVNVAQFNDSDGMLRLGKSLYILEDKTNTMSARDAAVSKDFLKNESDVPNLGVSPSTFWIKFQVRNNSATPSLLLELAYPIIDEVELFDITDTTGMVSLGAMGDGRNYSDRNFDHQNCIYEIEIPKNDSRLYLMKIKAGEQILLPLSVGTYKAVFKSTLNLDIVWGIYFGIIIVMLFYNLFIYFSVKDKVYLLYVIYIVLVGLTQGSLSGYTFRYLWPNSPWLANQSAIFFPAIVGIVLAVFLTTFMNTRKFAPKLHKGFYVTNILFIAAIFIGIAGQYNLGQTLIQPFAMLFSLYALFVAADISRKGYRPAKFFLLAWSIFLGGICLFVLKDFGILPYNNFTIYTMPLGSAIEVVMLSFALADRINTLEKEKKEAQKMELKERTEKQEILEKQTETLKIKVAEATHELQDKNIELEGAYKELQEAQAELLQQEKMVSLGQMAAGVAHEINNPIHITNQAIDIIEASQDLYQEYIDKLEKTLSEATHIGKELKELQDFKKEMEFDEISLDIKNAIKRAKNGIERTATITKELKAFSKIDSEGLVKTNINNDLNAMLDMLQSQIGGITVKRSYGNLPLVKCHSQKLNQLYQSIFTNAIEAIRAKGGAEADGLIEIRTRLFEGHVVISFADNGAGMSEEIKQKAFNPFFTTKGAQRKGLGLANAYRAMNEHDGKIGINSEPGKGTTIELILPVGHTNETSA